MLDEITRQRFYLPKQFAFLCSEAKEVLYSGAFGAGKSVTLCAAAVQKAALPNNRVGLGRKTLKALKHSTLVTLLEGDGGFEPVLPKGYYSYHKTDGLIKVFGGGIIVLFGIDHPETLGSWPFGSIYVDQCEELDEADWTMLLGRCRSQTDPIRQLGGACNPGHPQHWLAQRFGITGRPVKGAELVQTCTADNPFLPADYVEQLETLTGTDYARYVKGQWAGYEGLVYDEWNPKVHVAIKQLDRAFDQTVAGIDEGFVDPSVRLSCGLYRRNGELAIHVYDEFYRKGVQPSAFLDHCYQRSLQERTDIELVDPSAAGLVADLNARGIPARSGDNSILEGVRSVKWFLRVRGDGAPLITVDPRCVGLIGEMTAYVWKKDQDLPVDKNNHALDALRYVCQHFGASFTEPRIYVADMARRKEKPDGRGISYRDVWQRGADEEPEMVSVGVDDDFGWQTWN